MLEWAPLPAPWISIPKVGSMARDMMEGRGGAVSKSWVWSGGEFHYSMLKSWIPGYKSWIPVAFPVISRSTCWILGRNDKILWGLKR